MLRALRRKTVWIAAGSLLVLVLTPLGSKSKDKIRVLPEIARYDLRTILGEMHASLPTTIPAPLFDISPDQAQLAVNFCVPTPDSKAGSQGAGSGGRDCYTGLIDLDSRKLARVIKSPQRTSLRPFLFFRKDAPELVSDGGLRSLVVHDSRTLDVLYRFDPTEPHSERSVDLLLSQAVPSRDVRNVLAAFAELTGPSIEGDEWLGWAERVKQDRFFVLDLTKKALVKDCAVVNENPWHSMSIALSPNGRMIAYGRGDFGKTSPNLVVLDVDTCKSIAKWSLPWWIGGIEFAPDSKHLIVTCGWAGAKALMLAISDGQVVFRIDNPGEGTPDWSFAISNTGQWLAIDSSVYQIGIGERFSGIGHVDNLGADLWDLKSKKLVGRVRFPIKKVRSIPAGWESGLRFTSDEKALAMWNYESAIVFYQLPDMDSPH